MSSERLQFIDTHTGGEPTRVVFESSIRPEGRTLAEKRDDLRNRFDSYRRAIICEPRGSDVMVGALVTEPQSADSSLGVVFFNNVGYLGMCGHGMIGVAAAMRYLNRIDLGKHSVDTPVGRVTIDLDDDHRVSLQNVPSYRYRRQIPVELPDRGLAVPSIVSGDIAWGGNWFFICDDHGLEIRLSNLERLENLAKAIRKELESQQITGENGAVIDHVELIAGPSDRSLSDAKNYVLCPGGAYDRSPCGTGTSAKVACMAAEGTLAPGEIHRQESIVGSIFEASYVWGEPEAGDLEKGGLRTIVPSIRGSAYVNAEGCLILDPQDPFRMGIQ